MLQELFRNVFQQAILMLEGVNEVTSIDELINKKRTFGKFVSKDVLGKVLEGKALRWSRPRLFNDPFDFQIDFHIEMDEGVIESATIEFCRMLAERSAGYHNSHVASTAMKYLIEGFYAGERSLDQTVDLFKGYIKRIYKEIQCEVIGRSSSELSGILDKSLILCTTLEIRSLLMWSHYTEGHKGAFLLFRPLKDKFWGDKLPIHYDEKFPSIWTPEAFAKYATAQSDDGLLGDHADVTRAIMTKSSQWSYEREARFIISDDANTEFYDRNFEEDELTAVVFGCRFPADEAKKLKDQYSPAFSKAKFFSSRKLDGQFGLQYEALI